MPNWCSNALLVKGPRAKEIIDSICTIEGVDFNKIIPMPEHQPDTTKPDAFYGIDRFGGEEKEKFGENNWYDWSYKNWGVKWNASYTERKSDTHIEFETPWGPPVEVIKELSKQYKDHKFTIAFNEPLMEIDGFELYVGGELVECKHK